jgi:hypothetical protein
MVPEDGSTRTSALGGPHPPRLVPPEVAQVRAVPGDIRSRVEQRPLSLPAPSDWARFPGRTPRACNLGLVLVADSHDHVRMTVAEHLEREQAAVAALVVSGLLASNVQTPRCGESARPTLFAQIRGHKE